MHQAPSTWCRLLADLASDIPGCKAAGGKKKSCRDPEEAAGVDCVLLHLHMNYYAVNVEFLVLL